ncbi:hypothetical protein NM688_g3480 [Phlebia brevispora]|uniref:Uncharacterized protein n=1 Tax=Phlebia brevispora TaxID=194682 RepID=A0ACC1T615_9APHY|nr:hypothetical protein NM688_g3480 [Phlebia brevispora]
MVLTAVGAAASKLAEKVNQMNKANPAVKNVPNSSPMGTVASTTNESPTSNGPPTSNGSPTSNFTPTYSPAQTYDTVPTYDTAPSGPTARTNSSTSANIQTNQNAQIRPTSTGEIFNRFNIRGDKYALPAPNVAEALRISVPQTPEQFTKVLDSYIGDSGLQTFFPPGSRFLQTLAEKAAALRNDPTTTLGSEENIKRLTRLSLYHPVIYCDDSGSMEKDDRYKHQQELVKRIARISTKIVPDDCGVDLRFINDNFASRNLSAAQIESAVIQVRPNGGTDIGTALRAKILRPLVYHIIDRPDGRLSQPLLISIITDGHPAPEAPSVFKDTIVECRKKLVNKGYPATSVMFSISQIGDDRKAGEFLKSLANDDDIGDVIFCTTDRLDAEFKQLRSNEGQLEAWLLKILTSPLMDAVED